LDHGVTGYAYHTVPVALHAWFRHGDDYRQAVLGVIACGGDTDTTAAIVGGIVGAGAGKEGIPAEWLANLWEWPQTVTWMERLGRALATAAPGVPQRGVPLNIPALLLRNLFFALVVLGHGFRRLLPPY
jgi:hypothetical protein